MLERQSTLHGHVEVVPTSVTEGLQAWRVAEYHWRAMRRRSLSPRLDLSEISQESDSGGVRNRHRWRAPFGVLGCERLEGSHAHDHQAQCCHCPRWIDRL